MTGASVRGEERNARETAGGRAVTPAFRPGLVCDIVAGPEAFCRRGWVDALDKMTTPSFLIHAIQYQIFLLKKKKIINKTRARDCRHRQPSGGERR